MSLLLKGHEQREYPDATVGQGEHDQLALSLLTDLVACTGVASPSPPTPGQSTNDGGERVPGLLGFHDEDARDVVDAPPTVRVGETFSVTITTFGGGCESVGDESVILADTSAAVMIYDFTVATRPHVVCAAILKRLKHTVTLSFAVPGEGTIQVWGRRVADGTPPIGEPIVLE